MLGEEGEEAVKIERDFFSEGSEKEGEEVGLWGGEEWFCVVHGRGIGGNYSNDDKEGRAREEIHGEGGERGRTPALGEDRATKSKG